MATCQIAEFSNVGMTRQPLGMLNGVTIQNITISSSAAQSAALDNRTVAVRILSDTDCWVLGGANPTVATTTGLKVLAGQPEYFAVPQAGAYKLSIITA